MKSMEKQRLVDRVFDRCMALDLRELDAIREMVRRELSMLPAFRRWQPTDHELQIIISRNCTGDGDWDYYPAYSTPPRYVSRRRVLELARLETERGLDMWERRELDEQLADLERGVHHWRAKHATARRREAELDALIQRARHVPLDACAGQQAGA